MQSIFQSQSYHIEVVSSLNQVTAVLRRMNIARPLEPCMMHDAYGTKLSQNLCVQQTGLDRVNHPRRLPRVVLDRWPTVPSSSTSIDYYTRTDAKWRRMKLTTICVHPWIARLALLLDGSFISSLTRPDTSRGTCIIYIGHKTLESKQQPIARRDRSQLGTYQLSHSSSTSSVAINFPARVDLQGILPTPGFINLLSCNETPRLLKKRGLHVPIA